MDPRTRHRLLALAGIELRVNEHWKLQPRDPGGEDGGQWIAGGIAIAKTLADALRRWDDLQGQSGNALGSVDLGISVVDDYDGLSYRLHDPSGLLDELPSEVADSLFTYASTPISQSINAALRAGRDPQTLPLVPDIDKAVDVSRLTRPAVVYRGITDPAEVFGDAWNDSDVTGLEWREDGFLSTSADSRVADDFATLGEWASKGSFRPGGENAGRAVVVTLVVPEGIGAVRLSEMGRGQAELLLERGLELLVIRDHGVTADGIRRLDVLASVQGEPTRGA